MSKMQKILILSHVVLRLPRVNLAW